ncbi:MAG TPA: RodZ domain-containing protein [Candidatus Saccharimonadia bacterium]|jgi:cytoskeletal protein RodZ|nr:RodZ domain-containing protein [Candidatus Saccharimonadia bacterium]
MPDKPLNVGQQLKARRQALRLSLAQVEVDTKIRGKFLTALESGDYSSLPNDIYSRGFVQHYASHLGLDGAAVAAQYVAERGGVVAGKTKRPQLERPPRLVFTGRIVTVIGVATAVIGVVWYLLWQFAALAAAPSLTLNSPESDVALTGAVINVSGHVTPGADVNINDSPILTDTDGNFSEKVALQDGVNVIRVAARSKLGKATIVTRNVLAKLPKADPTQVAVPSAVFDGVAVAVAVKETTSVVVVVDGVKQFAGTFIAGKSLVFTGKTDISLTTGNAGATSVTVTNTVAANKLLSPLGKEGEIRRNQDFAKDTVIP